MDFRLIRETVRWMEENVLLGNCDIVSVAGSSKAIVDGSGEVREYLLGQISTSCSLHQACCVYIVHHSDCGAYGSVYDFATPAEEKLKQTEDMEKAAGIIKKTFDHVNVVKIWAQMQDDTGNKVKFEKIP